MKQCTVAIIVAYRDRPLHLPVFLHHMHFFLQRQQLDYTIFIVEQTRKYIPLLLTSRTLFIKCVSPIKKTHSVLTVQC